MRDWSRTLRPASFRGVSFYVDSEEFSNGGRNTVTHEFVRSEDVISEDMGRKGQKFKIKGYVVGDVADYEAQAVIAACCAPGEATLVRPLLGPVLALCTDISVSTAKDRMGYVEISMDFVEAGTPNAFPALPIGDRLAIEAIAGLATLATEMVLRYGAR
jgi:prophage DNA circulation protein